MPEHVIPCGAHTLSWGLGRPLVMGIVNVTPDSFSGDGLAKQTEAAFSQALSMIATGADIVDVGAESTRPGAAEVSVDEELNRLIPLLERLQTAGIPVSVDTYKAIVMAEAIKRGAGLINDISALGDSAAAATLLPHESVSVCLMHMQGCPRDMQVAPVYGDVVAEVRGFLNDAKVRAAAAGIAESRVILDPGFGFGKSFSHNQALFRALPHFAGLGLPILVGVSRKSMIGEVTGRTVGDRCTGSVAAAMLATQYGAAILRVHDVAQTVDALKISRALGSQ